mgnify:CR=1 FL=1
MNTTPSSSKKPVNYNTDDSLDLTKYLFLILGNWFWFLISIVVAIGIAWLINRYTKPVYEVKASLLIKESSAGSLSEGIETAIPALRMIRTMQRLANEQEILKSYSLNKRVIEKLPFQVTYVAQSRTRLLELYLYDSSPYVVVPDTSKKNQTGTPIEIDFIDKTRYQISFNSGSNERVVLRYGEPYVSNRFAFTIYLRDSANFDPEKILARNYFFFTNANSLIMQYQSKLNIKINEERRGSVLFLSVQGYNARQETDYLNTLLDEYISQGLEEKNQTAVNTLKFIDQQLGVLSDSLQGAEYSLQNFRLTKKLVDISQEGNALYKQLQELGNQKALLDLNKRYLEYLQDYMRSRTLTGQLVAPATANISDPLLGSLVQQLNELIAQRSRLQVSVQPGNPGLADIDTQIDALRQALLENIRNLLHNNTISLQENARNLAAVEKEMLRLPVTERQLINLRRTYSVNDQIYTFLLQKRAEAAIARASNVADNKVIDYAQSQNAALIAPKSRRNYSIALMLGILIPLVMLILLESLNTRVTSRQDIEQHTRAPMVSSVGHYTGSGMVAVHEKPHSAVAESFRGLRTNLQFLLRDPQQKIIVVTSTITGEGKTFTSVNLATVFALAGKKTLLVGLDLRKPKIYKFFNLENTTGISTFLIHQADFDEVIQLTKVENLYLASSGPIPPNPAELIGTEAMKTFLTKAREQFDMVVIDTPPFGLVTDSLVVGRLADIVLIVVRQMFSPRAVLDAIEDLFEKHEMKSIGIILNDIQASGYYYRYGYRYFSYGYGYGYGYVYGTKAGYYEDETQETTKNIFAKLYLKRKQGKKT